MRLRSEHILATGFSVFWLAAFVWIDGPARLMAAIPSVGETRKFIDKVVSWAHGPDHFVRLDCTGTLRTGVGTEPWGYSAVINADKKLLTINDYQPVQLVGDGDILTVTGAAGWGNGVDTVILNRDTNGSMVSVHEENGAKTQFFNGTCKRVDKLSRARAQASRALDREEDLLYLLPG